MTASRYGNIDILSVVLSKEVAVLLREIVYHGVIRSACDHKQIRRVGRVNTHIILAHYAGVIHELILCGEYSGGRCAAAYLSHLVAALYANVERFSSAH